MIRWRYVVLGLIVVAWLVLYLSTYGVLVDSDVGKLNWEADGKIDDNYVTSTELGGEASAGRMDIPGMTDTIRCTYFVATGVISVYSDARRRKVCPRLWDFNQPDSSVRD